MIAGQLSIASEDYQSLTASTPVTVPFDTADIDWGITTDATNNKFTTINPFNAKVGFDLNIEAFPKSVDKRIEFTVTVLVGAVVRKTFTFLYYKNDNDKNFNATFFFDRGIGIDVDIELELECEIDCDVNFKASTFWVNDMQVSDVNLINQLIYGVVTWVSGLIFDVSWCDYYIQGIRYNSDADQVTLDAAHATLDRIDVIYVDDTGSVGILKGTAGASPDKPIVDPITQLELTFISIPALATVPPDITDELVYDENIEWTTSSVPVANITVDFNDTTDPYSGSKDISITHDTGGSIEGANIKFVDSSASDITGAKLYFYLKCSKEWKNKSQLTIEFINGASRGKTAVMSRRTLMYGFDHTDHDWQKVAIDLDTLISPSGDAEIDTVRIYCNNDWNNDTELLFDKIVLQYGIVIPPVLLYNLVTQNDSYRTSFPMPNDDAADIPHAGNFRVASTTTHTPVGEGVISAYYQSGGASGLVFLFINEGDDSVEISHDKGTTWTALGGGGASPLTTKGDLFGYDTGDERIPIGTDTHVLIADSAQALGLKWGAVSAGAGGLTTEVQFNNAGALDGDSELVWDNTNKRLGIGGMATLNHPLEVDNNIATQYYYTKDGAYDYSNAGLTALNRGRELILFGGRTDVLRVRYLVGGVNLFTVNYTTGITMYRACIVTVLSAGYGNSMFNIINTYSTSGDIDFLTGAYGQTVLSMEGGSITYGGALGKITALGSGLVIETNNYNDVYFHVGGTVDVIKMVAARTTFNHILSLGGHSSAPSGQAGDIYYDTTTNKHYGHNGTIWNAMY